MNVSRRNFLGWTASGIAGLMLPQIVKPRVSTFVMGSGLRSGFVELPLPKCGQLLIFSGQPPPVNSPETGTLLATLKGDVPGCLISGEFRFDGHGTALASGTPTYARMVESGKTLMQIPCRVGDPWSHHEGIVFNSSISSGGTVTLGKCTLREGPDIELSPYDFGDDDTYDDYRWDD